MVIRIDALQQWAAFLCSAPFSKDLKWHHCVQCALTPENSETSPAAIAHICKWQGRVALNGNIKSARERQPQHSYYSLSIYSPTKLLVFTLHYRKINMRGRRLSVHTYAYCSTLPYTVTFALVRLTTCAKVTLQCMNISVYLFVHLLRSIVRAISFR